MPTIKNIPTNEIQPGNNDRTKFDKAAMQELADSIKKHGLAQPITVRPIWTCARCGREDADFPEWCDNCDHDEFRHHYEIVAGERRFRAICNILRQETIPAIVRTDLTNEAASAIMLAENVARADLDPIDEGAAYALRMERYGWSVQECAERAGVSPVRIRFRLKLLKLNPELRDLIRSDNLPLGYAQILADGNLDTNRQRLAIARLRDNPGPTPQWFRREVGKLQEEQAQGALFDLNSLQSITIEGNEKAHTTPALPSTTAPPATGGTLQEIIQNQVDFWTEAASQWQNLGKVFKRQECLAAAQALRHAAAII